MKNLFIEQLKNEKDLPDWLKESDMEPKFTITSDGRVVGGLWFRIIEPVIEIDYVFVSPEFRGQGFGTRLLHNFHDFCLENFEARLLWLEVSKNNPLAEQLYTKMDYKPVGLRKNYYPDGSDALNFSFNLETLQK